MARQYAWRSIAVKRMNMNTDDGYSMDAVHWFRNSLGETFNYEEAEDYAQAAIYFGQWSDVITAISAMTAVEQQERIWQYWLARAYEQLVSKPKHSIFITILQRDRLLWATCQRSHRTAFKSI